MIKSLFCNFAFLFLFLLSEKISAQLTVSKFFSDNMVLQQNAKTSIWGWSNAGDTIAVTGSWDNVPVKAVTNSQNKWTAQLQTPVAKTDGTTYKITVSGRSKITFSNVLIGEVWLLSGQSNMEMPLSGWGDAPVEGSAQAITSANYPNIRLFTVTKKSAGVPQMDITNSSSQKWQVCSPSTVPNFSAVGYFFGRELHQKLNIPIGLVNSSWGGSSCETWANVNSLEFVSDFAGKTPWLPKDANDNQTATVLYNGMIAPLIPFNFSGVCWYQGETNVGRAKQLTELFPAMIEGWRSDFQKENLPFYFVQLAPWAGYGEGPLPEFWEAQAYTLNLHHTEMAETLDCGNAGNIHPAKKEPIGYRLAQKALVNVYDKNSIVFAGPRYDSLKIEGNKIRLFFSHTGSGLKTVDSSLKNFEIAGSNNVFYAAQSEISGNEVLVWSNQVASPKNARYAWLLNAGASLYNKEGFPATPFRTNPPTWMEPIKTTFITSSGLINEGEKVQIRWTTLGAETVTMNNEKISFSGTMEVAPDTTTTYFFAANHNNKSVSKSSTVYVIPKDLKSWAKNKKATASTSASGNISALAVDENTTSYWSSNSANNQWLTLDLGESIPVELIILQWGAGYGKTYDIQVSNDNVNWTTLYSENNGDGNLDFIFNLKGNGRYIRIYAKTRTTTGGFEIKEFMVYSTETRKTGTLKDKNDKIIRGTPMVLGKNQSASVVFAADLKNWETIKNNGFNTIRVCWVDPWYKDHGHNYWKVSEVLPWFDKCVKNATASGMNIIINFHGVGSQQDFDKSYTFSFETEFWDSIAPRYKNNDLVFYEIANEPTFQMNDYLNPVFKQNLLKIYNNIRKKAPDRQILMFSFNTIAADIVNVVENYKSELNWDYTSVAYHMYNSTSSAAVKSLMAYQRVICTEWNYDFVSKKPDFGYIKQVDGFKENAQTLEKIGSGWIDWRDWDDTSLNELLDTLISDAKQKKYWWGVADPGIKVTGIKISETKTELNSGKTKQLTAFVYPALAGNQNVTWSSSNSDYVSVTETGLITAKVMQSKIAVITAKTIDGNFTSQCEVKVIAPERKGAYPDGGAHNIPGSINPTFYDLGGEGIGYHDFDAINSGNGIRSEQGVDTEFRLPEGSIGGIKNGEWLDYTIFAKESGNFAIEILFASPGKFGKFHIEMDDVNISGSINVLSSGSNVVFKPTRIENLSLSAGKHVMRIIFEDAQFNMGTISFLSMTTTLNMKQIEEENATVFPNPVHGRLYIKGIEFISWSIMDSNGQKIINGLYDNKPFINLRSLLPGNYILTLKGKTSNSFLIQKQ